MAVLFCSLRVPSASAGTMLSSQFYRDAGLAGLSRFSAANNAASSPSCVLACFNIRTDGQLHAILVAPCPVLWHQPVSILSKSD